MKKLIFILLFLQPVLLFSANIFDPDLKWKSIKTEHFWIHYHQGISEAANKLSVIAEKVYKQLPPKIRWEPALRTDVVLVDNMYTANGFAIPFPFNRIQIYLTRPDPDSSIANFDEWLEMVFLHEYVHILNIDTIHGLPSISRYTLGRCCFPNMFVPVWMLEGNAVYHESFSGFGRNNSTYTDMVLRTEIMNNSFKYISEASNFPREWPVGQVPYLYGGLFIEFLEKKYGAGSFADVFIDNSYNLIPYRDNTIPYILPFLNTSAENVFGETFLNLWDEWRSFLQIKYNRQLEDIKKNKISVFKKITDSGYYTSLPRFGGNGNKIYYIRKTNFNKAALALIDLSNPDSSREILCKVNDPNSISIADDTVYLSDAEFYKSFSIYNEAFIYRKRYKKITSAFRASFIDVNTKIQKAVFIKHEKNKFSMLISDLDFRNFKTLIKNSDIQMAYSKFSGDGERIAFTIKDKTGNSDLAVLNIKDGEISRLTKDGFNDIHPCWHPDGNRIVFSSDRDGIYNLYEYDIEKKILYRITNLPGGGFSPDISPDGRFIAFANYGKNGFDIAVMDYPRTLIKINETEPEKIQSGYFTNLEDSVSGEYQISDYTVLNSIFPPFWLPLIASSEVYEGKTQWLLGFFTLGTDALYKNSYMINAYTYTYEKRASFNIFYNFSYLYPEIIFKYENNTLFYGDDKFPWEEKNQNPLKRDMERAGEMGIAFPFIYYQTAHIISLSYKYSKTYTDYYNLSDYTRNKYSEASIRFKYSYTSSAYYSYSVSNEDGRDFYIISDFFKDKLGSDISYSKTRAEYAEYLPGIWRNNAIMMRIRGGAAFGNPDIISPYNLGRFEEGETGTPKTDEDEFGLRGYPSGKIYGKRIATGTMEYRLPIFQRDFGLATFPLMFRDLWITPFFEFGNVWQEGTDIDEFKTSAGIELNIKVTAGYMVDLEGYIGYAKGFNNYGESQVYFAVSTIFEGTLKNNYKWLDYF